MKKNKKTRQGIPAEIARLDFHSWDGRLVDRIKGKVTEKFKGIQMVENIENRFGITKQDIDRYSEESIREMREELDKNKPVVFTNLSRDKIENLHKVKGGKEDE